MAKYYHVAALKEGAGIAVSGSDVRIDLDAVATVVENDEQLLAAVSPNTYFYLSGGGTLLLNGRYLLVVQREQSARINPGQISIFTGRADNETEWMQPKRILRELFEELQLWDGDTPYRLRNVEFQPIIDQVQPADRTATVLGITPLPLHSHQLRVLKDGKECCKLNGLLHINSRRDINLMMVFTAEADMSRLVAQDKESANARMIAALDLQTNRILPLSADIQARQWQDNHFPLSEHLNALLETLKDTQ